MNPYSTEKRRLGSPPWRPARCRSSPGFMLMEMMFAIGILAAFALLATTLCVATLRIPQEAGEKQDAILRFESGLQALRNDVWEARSISSPDAQTLAVNDSTGGAITWKIVDGGVSRIPIDKKLMQTWNIAGKMSFSASGPTAVITVADDVHHADRIELLSQLMLTREERK